MDIKPKEIKPLIQKTSHFDLLFKYAFSIPRFAKELFKLVLSQVEFSIFDWSTLRAEKDSFQDLRADAVFSVAVKGHIELRFRIFLLLEHKSQYSRKVFCQMLEYQTGIIKKSLQESNQAWPTIAVVVYNGKQPWRWPKSFQEGLWGNEITKIPLSLQKSMLNYDLKVLDTHTPEVAKAIEDRRFKSRGFLNALRRAWDLKADEGELKGLISLFDTWTGDRGDSFVLNLGDYLWSVVPGMNKKLWDQLEHSAVQQGLFNKGGYMDIREYMQERAREEARREAQKEWWQKGRQEGRQEEKQEVVLNMLRKQADMVFISEVTGLSEEEIKKLKSNTC